MPSEKFPASIMRDVMANAVMNVCVCVFSQCWGRQDRSLHHPQHRSGADEVRGRGGSLPDGEDAPHPAARHGAD